VSAGSVRDRLHQTSPASLLGARGHLGRNDRAWSLTIE